MTMVFLVGCLLFLALAAHPFTTYPLSLVVLKRWRPQPLKPAARLRPYRYAICVAAYNEAAVIRHKAENLIALRQKLGDADLLVYVDGASDDTTQILGDFAPDIDVVVSPICSGKSAGMNTLLARTTADIVIFTDANAIIDLDGVAGLATYFDDPTIRRSAASAAILFTATMPIFRRPPRSARLIGAWKSISSVWRVRPARLWAPTARCSPFGVSFIARCVRT